MLQVRDHNIFLFVFIAFAEYNCITIASHLFCRTKGQKLFWERLNSLKINLAQESSFPFSCTTFVAAAAELIIATFLIFFFEFRTPRVHKALFFFWLPHLCIFQMNCPLLFLVKTARLFFSTFFFLSLLSTPLLWKRIKVVAVLAGSARARRRHWVMRRWFFFALLIFVVSWQRIKQKILYSDEYGLEMVPKSNFDLILICAVPRLTKWMESIRAVPKKQMTTTTWEIKSRT